MNIYRVTRTDKWGYDDYSDFVCVAPDAETARKINPYTINIYTMLYDDPIEYLDNPDTWVHGWVELDKINTLKVELIGVANESYSSIQILCASYHAG